MRNPTDGINSGLNNRILSLVNDAQIIIDLGIDNKMDHEYLILLKELRDKIANVNLTMFDL